MELREDLIGPKGPSDRPSAPKEGCRARGLSLAKQGIDLCRKNSFSVQIVLLLLYRLLLDVLYLRVISPLYGYMGMTTHVIPLQYLCSWAVVVVFAPVVVRLNQETRASSLITTFLNYLYFIPLMAYCGCNGADLRLLLAGVAYWALLLLWQFHIPTICLATLSEKHVNAVFSGLTAVSVLLVLYISGRYAGFRFTLEFINVYGIRAEAMAYEMPALLSYALSSMTVVLSMLLLFWARKRNFLVVALLVVIYLFYYSIAAHKMVFFFLILLAGCLLLYRPWMLKWMPGLLCMGAVVALLEKGVIGSYYIPSLFFRRLMFVPASLADLAAAFFQENPLNLFRDGIMGKLSFDSIYSTAIQYVLGEQRGISPGAFANMGLLGDLYSNLPVPLGLLLMPLVLVLCFRLLDMLSNRVSGKIVIAFSVFFAVSFMNISWGTVLLTNGYLVACILLYLFPKEEVRI